MKKILFETVESIVDILCDKRYLSEVDQKFKNRKIQILKDEIRNLEQNLKYAEQMNSIISKIKF